ncbi:MAG TPA: amidohydrolase family protein [Clostridiales bacterium]|nr:amidohydrolase family protein [Clostridiales bacterium]
MEIMDFHAHIYPDKIASKAVRSVGRFYGLEMNELGTAEALVENGRKAGVSRFLVHSVATVPAQVQNINNFIADECKAHTELTGFGTMHAEMDNPLEEIQRIEGLGLKGVKIHPDTQHFNIDDPKMMEIYDLIRGRLPIVIHCGDYRYSYSHPKRLAAVLCNFPDLTVVAAHFGGWSVWDLALEYLEDKVQGTRCFLDTSSSTAFLGKRRTLELIKAYGTDRILFGTDFPMWSAKSELQRVMSLNLSPSEYEQIFIGNAKRVLNED